MKGHGTRSYPNVVRQRVEAMLDELIKNGAKITGNNPWVIDTRQSGVKLRGESSADTSILSVTLIGKEWYVPSSMIWETIETLKFNLNELPDQCISAKVADQGGQIVQSFWFCRFHRNLTRLSSYCNAHRLFFNYGAITGADINNVPMKARNALEHV